MGTDIRGWVEINTIKYSNEDIWFGVIDISLLVQRNYSIFGILFGVRAKDNIRPIAPNRGLPADVLTRTKSDLVGEAIVNQSWILFNEIEDKINNFPLDEDDWGWKFIFNTMKELANYYDSKNVRLVAAFDNYG